MKRTIFTIILLNLAYLINAQEKTLKELIAEGNKVYVEFIDVKKNIPEAQNAINTALKGEEWNRWTLVEKKESADFILKVSVEKKGVNLLSMAFRRRTHTCHYRSMQLERPITMEVQTLSRKCFYIYRFFRLRRCDA